MKRVTTARASLEGEGFPVRRAFSFVDLTDLDPFIHMDQMGEVDYAPGEPRGTPWHPHRGFETFTYLIDGEFLHQDNHGGGGVITGGGTQYMTAGDGILHIETPPEHLVRSGGLFHGLQLWINLPTEKKRIAPAYQDLQNQDVALLTSLDAGVTIRVLAGELGPVKGPGISHTPLLITHITLPSGTRADIPWPSGFNALAYTLAGSGLVGSPPAPVVTGQMAVLGGGDVVSLQADLAPEGASDSWEVFLIGGEPLRQPVFQYGPFVMSTKSEVAEAFEDFQSGHFGQVPADAIQPFHL